jgi:hypothetical protein
MLPRRALPTAHFDGNAAIPVTDLVHWFSGTEGFRQLVLYFRDRLHVISGDLTGCIPHHHLIFSFGRVRLQTREAGRLAETNIAAKITFQGSKIIKVQIRISWPLVF